MVDSWLVVKMDKGGGRLGVGGSDDVLENVVDCMGSGL